jgi:hypothetical protein
LLSTLTHRREIDPHRPETAFLVQSGRPPGMARFDGPRNYVGQIIRIE